VEKIVGYEADALFVMIGADAGTSWLPGELVRESPIRFNLLKCR
jgi:hypothetical protein